MANAEVEWLVGTVRAWDDGSYGDPYQFSATARKIDDSEVELLGCTATMSRGIWRSLCKTFKAQGFETIAFTRLNAGEARRIRIDTTTCRRKDTTGD